MGFTLWRTQTILSGRLGTFFFFSFFFHFASNPIVFFISRVKFLLFFIFAFYYQNIYRRVCSDAIRVI